MTSASARRLGPYEFSSRLGAGGMGEVYRARDTRLGRDVAIKVLPPELSADADRLRRFEKEAQAASSLNHPNIVTIHEIERIDSTSFIVMELVDGRTLREVLCAGALPVRRLLALAAQIAEGLARAHSAGIVHRDLKPENVMVTKEGLVKILDFGLAKLAHPDLEGGQLTQGPTVSGGTAPGVVMGTVGYMSPEQASGHPVDFHSDQFSFGSLLYEMATGKAPFRRATPAQTLAAIIQDEPEPIDVSSSIPVPLRWIIERCLTKDQEGRYEATKDLARDLTNLRDHLAQITSGQASSPGFRGRHPRTRALLGWIVAVGFLGLSAALYLGRPPATAPPSRLQASVLPPPGTDLEHQLGPPAVSPDGRHVVFRASGSLWLRSFEEKESAKLPGTENASYPFWSPDGQTIGFVTFIENKLKRIAMNGPGPQIIGDVPGARGTSWGADDTIIVGQVNGPLYRIPATGGQPSPLTRLETNRGEIDHRWPYFLPGGRRFLYLIRTAGDQGVSTLAAGSLDTEEKKVLGRVSSNVAYSPPGYLVSATRNRTLIAQPFNLRSVSLSGRSVSIAEQVLSAQVVPASTFSISTTGVLAFVSGAMAYPTKLAWLDRAGDRRETFGPTADYASPAISPDEKRLAVQRLDTETENSDVWLYDFSRRTSTRLTADPGEEQAPVWSPSGKQIAFTGSQKGEGVSGLHVKSVDGSLLEEKMPSTGREQRISDWSPDSKYILYAERQPAGNFNLWAVTTTGERKAFPVRQVPYREGGGRFSPDGHFIAYVSDESGRFEVYTQTFPQATERWQVSTDGGREPRWRRDGKELFFLSPSNDLMSVQMDAGRPVETSVAQKLFPIGDAADTYDVAGDGKRFLLIVPDRDIPNPPITVVFHWLPDKLRR